MNKKKNVLVFVGTYNKNITMEEEDILNGKNKGIIYVFHMNIETGELILLSKEIGGGNPSYIALDQTKKYLYCTNELRKFEGLDSGAVSAFSLNSKTGNLTLLNRHATGGADPCYLMVNKSNTHLLVANYTGGSISSFPLASDGSITPCSCFLQHKGKSINETRQSSPHPHAIVLDRINKRVFVPDLGCDKVYIYKISFKNGCFNSSKPAYIKIKAGEGPRHCTFSSSGKYFYVITELGSSIYTYGYDEANGTLVLLQVLSTLPKDFIKRNSSGAIKILPGENYLYSSNRGHNSIATFKIDNYSGLLNLVSIHPSGGLTPKDFTFDPTGNYLLVANQESHNIVVFRVNRETGTISETSCVDNVYDPTCIKAYYMN